MLWCFLKHLSLILRAEKRPETSFYIRDGTISGSREVWGFRSDLIETWDEPKESPPWVARGLSEEKPNHSRLRISSHDFQLTWQQCPDNNHHPEHQSDTLGPTRSLLRTDSCVDIFPSEDAGCFLPAQGVSCDSDWCSSSPPASSSLRGRAMKEEIHVRWQRTSIIIHLFPEVKHYLLSSVSFLDNEQFCPGGKILSNSCCRCCFT